MSLLIYLDRLAGWWLDWRTERVLAGDEELTQFNLKRFEASEAGMQITAVAPGIAILADQAAQLLKAVDAENYFQFDMMPRLDRGLPPVRVTIQWARGKSPAQVVADLKAENARLRALSDALK